MLLYYGRKGCEIVEHKICQVCAWGEVEIDELNIQSGHVHMLISVPPKRALSEIVGTVKEKSTIHKARKRLKEKPY